LAVCYRHPDRETNVGCSNCGRPICPDCMTSTSVGMRCPECSRQTTKVTRGTGGGFSADRAPLTVALIVLNVVAYFAEMAGGASSLDGGGSVITDFGLFGPAVDDGEWYRIVTCGFLHAGLIHLGFNMFALWILGSILEPGIGSWRFAAIYFVSLLGGSFGALLLDPLELTVGASGAVFGLMAAAFIIARQRGLQDLASQIGFFVVINLVFTFSVPGISVGGHLGGLVAGALIALGFAVAERRGQAQARPLEIAITLALGAACVVGSMIAAADSVPAGLGG
jgi:membrane associated rhomboid family serine protease